MRQIDSRIDIAAPAALVWAILADFRTYGRWNPLILGVLGMASAGRRIEIRVRARAGGDVTCRPIIVRLREPREMDWVETWRWPGVYRSERRFRIETLPSGDVRFHHGERVDGMLAPLLGVRRAGTQSELDAMNRALKQRAERAWVRPSTAQAA